MFGAQHMQQLQVIQRLQAQRAAMLAARASNGGGQQTTLPAQSQAQIQQPQPTPVHGTIVTAVAPMTSSVCTECAECAECAAKQLQDDGMYFFWHPCISRSKQATICAITFYTDLIKCKGCLLLIFFFNKNKIIYVWYLNIIKVYYYGI